MDTLDETHTNHADKDCGSNERDNRNAFYMGPNFIVVFGKSGCIIREFKVLAVNGSFPGDLLSVDKSGTVFVFSTELVDGCFVVLEFKSVTHGFTVIGLIEIPFLLFINFDCEWIILEFSAPGSFCLHEKIVVLRVFWCIFRVNTVGSVKLDLRKSGKCLDLCLITSLISHSPFILGFILPFFVIFGVLGWEFGILGFEDSPLGNWADFTSETVGTALLWEFSWAVL